MKKNCFITMLFWVCLGSSFLAIGQDTTLLLATRIQTWGADDTWVGGDSILYTYNSEGLLIIQLRMDYQAEVDSFINERAYYYSYDEMGNWIERIDRVWNETEWQDLSRVLRNYNENNLLTFHQSQYPLVGQWYASSQSFYEYDEQGNMTSSITQTRVESNWENWRWLLFTYDGNNNRTEELWNQWDGTEWVISTRITNVYDEYSNQTSSLTQGWSNNAWQNAVLRLYEYDAQHNLILEELKQFESGQWVDSWKDTFSYDQYNQLIHRMKQNWYDFLNDWQPGTQQFYTYDLEGNNIYELRQWWIDTSWVNTHQEFYEFNEQNQLVFHLSQVVYVLGPDGEWSNQSRRVYYYGVLNSNETINEISFSVRLIPNPNRGSCLLSFSDMLTQPLRLTIFNTQQQVIGRRMILAGTIDYPLNLSGFPAGTYFLQFQDGQVKWIERMIVVE